MNADFDIPQPPPTLRAEPRTGNFQQAPQPASQPEQPPVVLQQHEQRPAPFLVYLRTHGWVVCDPYLATLPVVGFLRPGEIKVTQDQVLARCQLPPPPKSAM